jgi:hypothetical protein
MEYYGSLHAERCCWMYFWFFLISRYGWPWPRACNSGGHGINTGCRDLIRTSPLARPLPVMIFTGRTLLLVVERCRSKKRNSNKNECMYRNEREDIKAHHPTHARARSMEVDSYKNPKIRNFTSREGSRTHAPFRVTTTERSRGGSPLIPLGQTLGCAVLNWGRWLTV